LPPARFVSIKRCASTIWSRLNTCARDRQFAVRHLIEECLQRHRQKIFHVARVGRQRHARRDHVHRREVRERPAVANHARHAHHPRLAHRRERVGQCSRADQFQHLVGATVPSLPHRLRERAVVDEEELGAARTHQRFARGVARGRADLRTMRSGDGGRCKSDRGGAAADQQALAALQAQAAEQRAPGSLQHLRQGAKPVPGQGASERAHLACRHTGVFGITAVECAAHAAHHSGDRLPLRELAAGRGHHRADRLDAEDAR
jgi:hypothetical protein